jgi:hypothetical protein
MAAWRCPNFDASMRDEHGITLLRQLPNKHSNPDLPIATRLVQFEGKKSAWQNAARSLKCIAYIT